MYKISASMEAEHIDKMVLTQRHQCQPGSVTLDQSTSMLYHSGAYIFCSSYQCVSGPADPGKTGCIDPKANTTSEAGPSETGAPINQRLDQGTLTEITSSYTAVTRPSRKKKSKGALIHPNSDSNK